MKDIVRWGVLGAARIAGQFVVPALQRSRNSRVLAVAGVTLCALQLSQTAMGSSKYSRSTWIF
jgi:predicted dehydrogenase